jgi:Anti-sigma-K factor rskA, C-terminal/Putative zinc-finger
MSEDLIQGSPEHPDLTALLRGELSNAEVLAVAEHLEECEPCRIELAETAVGHALLSRAGRTISHVAPADSTTAAPVPAAPRPPSPRSRWARPVTLAAAAAVLVAGTAVVTTVVTGRDEPGLPVAEAPKSADLEPVEGSGSGRVEMVDDDGAVSMTVETRDLPRIKKGEYYQVWLFNPETGKMLSLGILGPGGKGGFEVPESLVGRYQVVDVSLERDDGDPAHSVTSVLRAAYTDPGTASS